MTPECPSNADLRRMLDGQLPAGEQGAAMRHVEACLRCQAALEQLTSCDDLFPTSGRQPSDLDRSTDEIVASGETGGRSSPASTLRPWPLEAEPDPGPLASLPSRTPGDGRHRGDPEGWPEIAGYQILGELGRGGMGVVYLARHQALNRLVAVKMILAGEQASPHQLVRFRAEGEIVASLRHPNIVQIFEFGWHGRQPYFVLEYVEGGNLEQWLAGRPMPPRQAAELVETLARASHYAHEQ